MSTNKRTILELHFHSHGDLQMGPRTIGTGTEETVEEATDEGGGISIGPLVLAAVGAIAFALLRRRSRGEEEPPTEQKDLDRWIPTR